MVYATNVNAVHLVRNVGRSLRGTLAGLRRPRLRPAWLEEPNDGGDEIIRPNRLRSSHLDNPTLSF